MSIIWAAITLGFISSLHCVGMCGPIALALPLNRTSSLTKVTGIVLYNLGRIFTYALLGGLFGLIGESFIIGGYQQTASIALGIAILIMVLLPNQVFARFKLTGFIYNYIGKLKQSLGKLFQKSSYSSLFFIGTLNGLLPCGVVYMAIAGAIATGNSLEGSLFMAVFGLGTLPAMASISMMGNVIGITFRNQLKRFVPTLLVLTAILLILRGSNLGIPYISPEMSTTKAEVHKCCHK